MNKFTFRPSRPPVKCTTTLLSSIVALAALSVAMSASTAQAAPDKEKWAQGRIIVKAKAHLSDTDFAKVLNRVGAHSVGKIHSLSTHIVNVPAHMEEAIAQALSKVEGIEFAELDRLVPVDQTANDPYFVNEWHLNTINAGKAWDFANGTGIVVAVLDTGVNIDHADLQGQMLPGWNAVNQSTDYSDIYGHGTKVAGTIGATTNNGTGVASIAYSAKILPIRVTNDSTTGSAYWSDIARGVTWAADHGARVANISYDVTTSAAITSSAQYMNSKGGLVVVSAGNSGTDLGYADNKSIISVSATASNDTLTSWSSFGNYIDVAAPGAGIYTTEMGGGYAPVSGTSFSSPVTAGVVALILSANPALTASEAESILKSTATDLGTAGWDNHYGYGRVDAAAAVAKALAPAPVSPVDTQAPIATLNLSAGATVSGTQVINVSATDNVGVTKIVLSVDGNVRSTSLSATLAYSWDTTSLVNGSHTVSAIAYDSVGNQGAVQVSVNVSNIVVVDTTPPSVSITSPANGATIRGNTQFKVVASDNTAVKQIACYFDSVLVGLSTDLASMNCNVNTRKYPTGSHLFKTIAIDAAKNSAETSILVNVVR